MTGAVVAAVTPVVVAGVVADVAVWFTAQKSMQHGFITVMLVFPTNANASGKQENSNPANLVQPVVLQSPIIIKSNIYYCSKTSTQ